MQFAIPYKDPAKFGAKSCEFCRFVKVEAPLLPKDNVIKAKANVTSQPTADWAINNNPGKKWAKIWFIN